MKNYLIRGLHFITDGIIIGCIFYAIIFICMLLKKKKRNISIRILYEMILCFWFATVVLITGIFPLDFRINIFSDTIVNLNLIPFIGGSFTPMILNTVMFVPLGFLLPLIYEKKTNWKKILLIGGIFSFIIEIIQLFEGRYAEIDDLILNALGSLLGYNLYSCIVLLKQNKKKAFYQSGILCIIILGVGSCVWLFCNHNIDMPDGINAVEEKIERITFLHNGEKLIANSDSYEFIVLCTQLNNCNDHIIDVQAIENNNIINLSDYYIEIEFNQLVTISFQNEEDFIITNIDKLLYNANTNYIYWGETNYQKYLDFTKLDESLEQYEPQILSEYNHLTSLLEEKFQSK